MLFSINESMNELVNNFETLKIKSNNNYILVRDIIKLAKLRETNINEYFRVLQNGANNDIDFCKELLEAENININKFTQQE